MPHKTLCPKCHTPVIDAGGALFENETKHHYEEDCFRALQTRVEVLENAKGVLLFVLAAIVRDLPSNKDWLDPQMEAAARSLVGANIDIKPAVGLIEQAAYQKGWADCAASSNGEKST